MNSVNPGPIRKIVIQRRIDRGIYWTGHFTLLQPIYYVNAETSVSGTAYSTILADFMARFLCHDRGMITFFLTGTDEHGDKIFEAARQRGVTPAEYADSISGKFRQAWDAIGIRYDRFIRTTDEHHIRTVQGNTSESV